LASPVRRALYVAISRLLYNTSDGPSVIFQKRPHTGFGMATTWLGLVPGPTCIAGLRPLAHYLIIAS
jgi:hypothetical protein